MATKTNKLQLHKIDLNDAPPDITVLNQNFDKLDNAVMFNGSNLTVENLSDPNFPYAYECNVADTIAPNIGLPANHYHLKYYRNDANNGYGFQMALPLYYSDNNNKILVRGSTHEAWLNWVEVITSASLVNQNQVIYVTPEGNDATAKGTADAPYGTIQKAIDSISKNLNGFTVVIKVGQGEYSEDITIGGFYGGELVLERWNEEDVCIINGKLSVLDCHSIVSVRNLRFNARSSETNMVVNVSRSDKVTINNCEIIGNGKTGCDGIVMGYLTNCFLYSIHIDNVRNAIIASSGAKCFSQTCNIINSSLAYYATAGMLQVLLGTTDTDTLYLTDTGGRIYVGSQTNLPNY